MTTIMTKRLWYILFAVFLAVVYGYVLYELFSFDHYDDLLYQFSHMTIKKYVALFLIVLLSPFCAVVEAMRWRTALRSTVSVSFRESLRHVLTSWAAALITPARVGEIPARALSVETDSRWQALATAALCSILQSLVIIGIGLWPAIMWSGQLTTMNTDYYIVVMVVVTVLWLTFRPLCKYITQHTQWEVLRKITEGGAYISNKDYLRTLALTLIRYATFCTQLFMMFRVMGVPLSVEDAIVYIPAYYLPSLPTFLSPMPACAGHGLRWCLRP